MPIEKWHIKTTQEILKIFGVAETGLSQTQLEEAIVKYGENKLPDLKVDSFLKIFLSQFKSPLIYILMIAATIIFAIGEAIDSIIISAVLILNAVIGTIQEGKANNILMALRKFIKTNATTIRNGEELIISSENIFPGDIILLQEGEKVPADARIIESHNLKIDEASITGESEPVSKNSNILNDPNLAVHSQKNMLFKGTNIVTGNAKAIVVATGMNSFIGKITKQITTIDTKIPLKENIRHLSHMIVWAVLAICVLVFFIGIYFDHSVVEMFSTIVSLAVSVIPEGLPIVMTLVLSSGVWRMSKRNVLIKKLHAVEALGQAKIIAVDKTGTITKNELVVQKFYTNNKIFTVSGVGYESIGEIFDNQGGKIDLKNAPDIELAARTSSLCAKATIIFQKQSSKWIVGGDPTEAAMLVFANKSGFQKKDLEQKFPQIMEIPFDAEFKYHAALNKINNKNFVSISGAPEVILNLSNKICLLNSNGEMVHQDLSEEERERQRDVLNQMSQEGLRLIGIGCTENDDEFIDHSKIKNISFVGFLGMKDAIRSEVADALLQTKLAGIRVVMITGDHKITARAIAKDAGIFKDGDEVLSGDEINEMSLEELSQKIANVSVFARSTPEHKLKIIQAFKNRGEIIAMTGDGVNDAPSLVAADLGVSMGNIGTEVAKEASDIVLLDDNFGSIVSGVEEGRSIYKTIRKVMLYLFSTGFGEVLIITAALIGGYPLPLLPAQIIWTNFVTDGFLDISLAMEPKEKDLLKEKFSPPAKYLVDKIMIKRIIIMGLIMMFGTMWIFTKNLEQDKAHAMTIAFTTLVVFQWFNAWNCRSENKSIFTLKLFSNPYLVGATLIVITLQMFAIYHPFMQKVLHTTPLSLVEWLMIIAISSSIFWIEELRKIIFRKVYI